MFTSARLGLGEYSRTSPEHKLGKQCPGTVDLALPEPVNHRLMSSSTYERHIMRNVKPYSPFVAHFRVR